MQVTDEMVAAAMRAFRLQPADLNVPDPDGMYIDHRRIRDAVQAALDTMPKAAGGYVSGPGLATDRIAPGRADVRPPQKVRDAADAVPGVTFNLDQEYGRLDEAARKKLLQDLRFDVRDSTAQADDDQQDGDGHAGH